MKKVLFAIFVLSFISCQNKEEKAIETDSVKTEEKEFEMYQMSEMAALMEQMYVDNQRLKERIVKGDTIGQFPQHFLKIHKAVMTDEDDNDAFFKEQAALFITSQELIYKDPKNAKEHFNKGVDACVQCHQQKCGGPIPRIKKLYIKE
jgi:cytochrome c553